MVKREQGHYEDIVPLPVSTREPGEGAGLLSNGHISSDKHVGAFDVEFDIEDDVLLHWQHARPSGWVWKRLPRSWQQVPECWLRLSKQQRNLVISGGVIMGVLLLCLAIIMAAWTGAAAQHYKPQYLDASHSPYCSWSDLSLPKGLQPTKYSLHVKTTLQEPYAVTGQVDIQLRASEATPCVVLHAHGMDIKSVELLVYKQAEDLHSQHPHSITGSIRSSNKTSQQVVLQFNQAVPQQPLVPVLRLQFSYTLQEGLDGFYRSSYIDATNTTKVMASTQFESIAARKAFPCFDEPSFKAVFEVKVSAPPPPVVVLSNMPLSHTHQQEHGSKHAAAGNRSSSSSKQLTEKDLIAYHFHPTPAMSTYLVAWAVGELAHNERQCELTLPPPDMSPSSSGSRGGSNSSSSSGGGSRGLKHEGHKGGDDDDEAAGGPHNITVTVWGTTDRVQQFGQAKDVACAALQGMEQLTQVGYALPKLDLVAIPNFAAGAMENWGLLMYRERALLVDDAVDDMHQRYAIATTVSHETAHQWFGNLATLEDWTQLWVNEGFAAYFEAVLADLYQPGMGYLTNFFADTVTEGLEADGSLASHPLSINRTVRSLSEIDNWFDSVSYNKGAGVLRMLRAWLNRNDNAATGLESNSDAPSAAAGDSGRYASTSQQWAPHLRRLQQEAGGSSSGSARGIAGSSMADSSDGSIVAAGVPRLLPGHAGSVDQHTSQSSAPRSTQAAQEAAPATSWHSHRHPKGPPVVPQLSASAAAPAGPARAGAAGAADEAGPLEVLPVGAPVPESAAAAAAAAAGAKQPAAAALSVGSAASWQQQQRQAAADPSRELGGAVGAGSKADTFMTGLGAYLKSHAYSNSGYQGVWDSLAQASGEPVQEMMSVWTLRRGFPIVSVSLGADDGSSSRRDIKVEQVPYHAPRTYMVGLPFPPEMYCNDWSEDPQDSSWWVPLPIRLPGVNNVQWHSFNTCSTVIKVDMPRNEEPWVLANTGRFGFYRVNYSEPLWASLATVATSSPAYISSLDLAGLLDDAYTLSHVRQLNITTFLQLVKGLGVRARPELPPWNIGLGWLQRMTDVLSTAALLGQGGQGQRWKDCMADLKKFVTRQVTKPFIQGVNVPGQDKPGLTFQVSASDPPELRLLRPLVLEAAGFLGYTQAMNAAVDLLLGQAGAIAPDVSKAVYALAAASGSEAAYNTLVNMYEQATDAADKDRALRALARVTTKSLISKTLEYSLSPAVRTQDVSVLLVRLAKQGGLGFNMTWQFVIDRADDILKKYGGEDVTYILGRRLNDLARLFVDEDLLNRLKQLAKAKPQIFSPTFFEEANEARMLNYDWLRFQGTDACSWLSTAVRQG